ncbi:MAG: inositol monophosphatase family protein [Pyrinomonadaceae bacterium]
MLNFAIETAREAGQILLEKFGRKIEISKKGNINLVTEADFASEKLIIEKIRSYYPKHSILAEESGESNGAVIDGDSTFGNGSLTRSTERRIMRTVIRVSA